MASPVKRTRVSLGAVVKADRLDTPASSSSRLDSAPGTIILACASIHECTRSWVSEEAARAASSALAMVDTAKRLLDRDLEASDDAGVSASRE